MKTRFDSSLVEIANVPVGGVFSKVFGEREFVRLVRLGQPTNDREIMTVTIGPHFSTARMPSIQLFDPDEFVVWEKSVEIFPKIHEGERPIFPKSNSDMKIGDISFPSQNEIILRAKRNDRIVTIDLVSGKFSNSHMLSPTYEHYVLTASDEIGECRVIFDSSVLSKHIALAAV